MLVSFNPRSLRLETSVYSHPDALMLKLRSISNLRLMEICWEV